jgi:hypothetical protein
MHSLLVLLLPGPAAAAIGQSCTPKPPASPCRGEALMHAQLATREAEEQSLQLADMLTTALQQLGIEITPAKQPAAVVSPMLTPPPGGQLGRGNGLPGAV